MKSSLGNDALKLTISKVVAVTISMITVKMLSNFLTLKEYGTYAQILLVVNIISSVFMLGLPNSINFFLSKAENDEEKQKFLSVYYTLTSILSFVTGLVLVFSVSIVIDYFNNTLIRSFLYVLAVYPWAKIILSSVENIFIVYQRTSQLLLFRLVNSLSLLFIIIIVEYFDLRFSLYMFLFVIVESIFALSVYIFAKQLAGKLKISLDKKIIKKVLEFSVPIGLASVVGLLSIELDKIMIGLFFTTEELAIYTNAARELPVTIIAVSLTAVLMPKLVQLLKQDKIGEAINLWGDTISLSYLILCFFSVGMFVYAPEVISLLYSEQYLPGVNVFRVYTIVLLMRFTYFGIILNSIGKTKIIFYSSIAALILNVVLNYISYLTFGFIGPAIATFMALTLVAAFQLIATSKSVQVPLSRMMPWKELYIISFINLTLGIIFYFLKRVIYLESLIGEVNESLLLAVIWGLIYLVISKKYIKKKWTSLNEK